MISFKNKKLAYGVLVGFVVLNVFLWQNVFEWSEDDLEVYFFDIGQGDAIYFRTPDGQDVIVDGGPNSIVATKLGERMPFYDKKIELMILTHPDADHVTGLVDVLEQFEVEQILYTGLEKDTAVFKKWKKLIEEKGVPMIIALAGQRVVFDDDVFMEIYHPSENLSGQEAEDANATSITGKLIFRENEFMLTGDIDQAVESDIMSEVGWEGLGADVLKVAHHGSKNSSDLEFLKAVSPDYAIIQSGKKNTYGHPHEDTLESLEVVGAEVWRNDEDGDVRCVGDGVEIRCDKVD